MTRIWIFESCHLYFVHAASLHAPHRQASTHTPPRAPPVHQRKHAAPHQCAHVVKERRCIAWSNPSTIHTAPCTHADAQIRGRHLHLAAERRRPRDPQTTFSATDHLRLIIVVHSWSHEAARTWLRHGSVLTHTRTHAHARSRTRSRRHKFRQRGKVFRIIGFGLTSERGHTHQHTSANAQAPKKMPTRTYSVSTQRAHAAHPAQRTPRTKHRPSLTAHCVPRTVYDYAAQKIEPLSPYTVPAAHL